VRAALQRGLGGEAGWHSNNLAHAC